jgi:hypothetical protein
MKHAEIELKGVGKAKPSTTEIKAANVPQIPELTEEQAKAQGLKQREFPEGVIPERLMEFIKTFEEHSPSHRDYLAAGMLMAISTVAAGKFGCRNRVSVALNTGTKSTPCNLFLLIVGRTSKGKSVGLNMFMNPLEKIESELAKGTPAYVSHVAAKRIQRAWRRAICDPEYAPCQRRLAREFEAMGPCAFS